jgi:hypothetical protein
MKTFSGTADKNPDDNEKALDGFAIGPSGMSYQAFGRVGEGRH